MGAELVDLNPGRPDRIKAVVPSLVRPAVPDLTAMLSDTALRWFPPSAGRGEYESPAALAAWAVSDSEACIRIGPSREGYGRGGLGIVPSDTPIPIARIEIRFRIKGVLHGLQLGPMAEGLGGGGPAWDTGMHGEGTSMGLSLGNPSTCGTPDQASRVGRDRVRPREATRAA
jgi:hypothetical protein